MALTKHLAPRLLAVAVLAATLGTLPTDAADNANSRTNRDVGTVLVQMRLRRLTQDLNLTLSQQAQFKALLENETLRISQVQADPDIALTERFKKEQVVRDEMRGKMRQVLTEEQQPKWDAGVAKTKARKGKNADNPASEAKAEKKEVAEAPKDHGKKSTDTAPAEKPAASPK